jgi:hypothetical protein
MTVYLVPCGLSMLDNLDKGKGGPDPAPPDRAGAMTALRSWQRTGAVHRAAPGAVLNDFRHTFEQIRDDLCLADWKPMVSAETSTLAARTRHVDHLQRMLDDGHAVALLASQTEQGMLAALLVAAYLADEKLDRIMVAATPPPGPAADGRLATGSYPMVPGTVTVIRISHLSPDVTDGFRDATFGIGDVMRAARDIARGGTIEVHLSGGHKATLLQTMALAEILKSVAVSTVPAQNTGVSAWYLFEDAASVTEIGLRTFDEEVLPTMRDELDCAWRGKHPQTNVLRGHGWLQNEWLQNGQKYTLTPFGRGYQALLGAHPPSTEGRHG